MDTVTLIGRLLVSLAVVLGVVWLVAKRMRKSGGGRASGLIEVLDRRQLSRGSSVAVVRVGDQALVIGVTDNQVTVLGETDADRAIATNEAARPAKIVKPVPARAAHRTNRRTVAAVDTTDDSTDSANSVIDSPVATTPAAAVLKKATPAAKGALAGSALSPQTWKQTIESLREMTAR